MEKKTKEEIRKIWIGEGFSTRNSYNPDFIKKICPKFGIKFDKRLIYTKDRYRELSDGNPRIDALDFLRAICKFHGIEPNKKDMETANCMSGEGSHRSVVQKAYIGESG